MIRYDLCATPIKKMDVIDITSMFEKLPNWRVLHKL